MLSEERQRAILETLDRDGRVLVVDLLCLIDRHNAIRRVITDRGVSKADLNSSCASRTCLNRRLLPLLWPRPSSRDLPLLPEDWKWQAHIQHGNHPPRGRTRLRSTVASCLRPSVHREKEFFLRLPPVRITSRLKRESSTAIFMALVMIVMFRKFRNALATAAVMVPESRITTSPSFTVRAAIAAMRNSSLPCSFPFSCKAESSSIRNAPPCVR